MKDTQINIEPIFEIPVEKINPYGNDISSDRNEFIKQCKESLDKPDVKLLISAFDFCIDAHKNDKRESGEPYYTHPLKVAMLLMKDFSVSDDESIIAALLHDTVEDVEEITPELLIKKFGQDVALIVDGVTKIKGVRTRQMDKAATYGKLFLALVKDIRVIIIKLADRLDNMRTLRHLKDKNKQIAIAHETLYFYTPFAERLGLTKVKKQFEDLSLYFIDKTVFDSIHQALENKRIIFIEYIKNFLSQISKKLNERNVSHVLTIEHKHVYKIFTMIEQGTALDEIDNFYSMVITLHSNDYSEAYRVYGIIANVFGPVSSLDDFIARPKINLYRALHSIHFGPGRKLVEVIIRTEEMEDIIEKGIFGYYSSEQSTKQLPFDENEVTEWVDWMEELIYDNDVDAVQKIWGSIRKNLYEDDMVIHTKDGESFILPVGSCPIDLAFAVSDDIAMHCISAKVNNDIKSLDYELKNNDYVELISSPQSLPDSEWLNFVITNKAVTKLYSYFKKYKHEASPTNSKKRKVIKLRINGEARHNLLRDIRQEIGIEKIKRNFLYNANSEFEALLHIYPDESGTLNTMFTKLMTVKGVKGIERVDEE